MEHKAVAGAEIGRHFIGWALFAGAFAIYIALTIPLRHWFIDDAAISMAYAANWTAGHGLVAQPGLEPVEGYSNPLWVTLLAVLDLFGLMTVPVIKAVSSALVGLSLLSLSFTCRRMMPNIAGAFVLLLVATNSAVVTWTTSGLENPLTLLLACEVIRVVSSRRWPAYAGLLIAGMALNRPEGLIFAVVPLWAFRRGRPLLVYLSVVAVIVLSFLAVRYATFGDVVPNTFYAKEASRLTLSGIAVNAIDLLNGPFGSAVIMIGILAYGLPLVRRDDRPMPILIMMAVAGGVYILMPPDWMPDRRFATAFIPAACVFAGLALGHRPMILAAIAAVSLAFSGYRLAEMYRAPTTPMALVDQFNRSFEERARLMGVDHASLLMPDIGAALLKSNLRIYDLAGLTDRVIARTLYRDKTRFHDYVFDELQPTFIKTHTVWTVTAGFDRDPRFARDYLQIADGEYVRRDALGPQGRDRAIREAPSEK